MNLKLAEPQVELLEPISLKAVLSGSLLMG